MAADHALAEAIAGAAGSGESRAALRFYQWARPTVSFGRNEPAGGREAWAGRSADFVRRPTGGRAVLHAAELTYAAVVPARALGGARAAYRAVNEALVEGLRALGVDARLVEDAPGGAIGPGAAGRVAPLDAGPCFGSPAPGEIVVGGRKLVGSAQARIGGALLQHGSILLEDAQPLIGAEAVGLRELLPGTSAEEVRAAVEEGFRARFGGEWARGGSASAEEARAACLERERYVRDAWTWRR